MRTPESERLIPSAQRVIPLRAKPDLVAASIPHGDGILWVIKDPVALTYHRLSPAQYVTLKLLDGTRTLLSIKKHLARHFPDVPLSLVDLQSLIAELYRSGLLISQREGQGFERLRRENVRANWKAWFAPSNLIYLRLPGWSPDRLLTRFLPATAWVFSLPAVVAALGLSSFSLLLLAVHLDEFRSRLPQFATFFGWPNVLGLWLTIGITKVVHELGHGLACKRFGCECHGMGVVLFLFSPSLYCDATDSWLLMNKWHRIAVSAAGMYFELVLSAIAFLVWWFSQPGLLHFAALNVCLVSSVSTVIWNANPLMRLDGYYILSDLVGIPNLHARASEACRAMILRHGLGVDGVSPSMGSGGGQYGLAAYSIAASFYRVAVCFGAVMFLYAVLKPYRLGEGAAAVAGVMVFSSGLALLRKVREIVAAARGRPWKTWRLIGWGFGATAVLVALCRVPIPWYLEAPCVIEPHNAHQVIAQDPGVIGEVFVRPGDRVAAGEQLVRLENPELEERRHDLATRCRQQRAAMASFQALSDVAQVAVALSTLRSLEDKLRSVEAQQQKLTLTAPVGGRIVAAPRVLERQGRQVSRLSSWFGTPLDEWNVGAFIERHTHILTIAPDERVQAVLLIDQADRNAVIAGTRVRTKFNHLPHEVFAGVIHRISERHSDDVPRGLSVREGGPVATVVDQIGRERMASIAYHGLVVLDDDRNILLAGMQGRARCIVVEHSIAGWLWRYLRLTLHFRM